MKKNKPITKIKQQKRPQLFTTHTQNYIIQNDIVGNQSKIVFTQWQSNNRKNRNANNTAITQGFKHFIFTFSYS